MAPALSPVKAKTEPAPSFEMIQSPPPPVFSTTVIQQPAPPCMAPPPSFDQFMGTMEPVQPKSVSYPKMDLAPPPKQQPRSYQPTYTSVQPLTTTTTTTSPSPDLDMSEAAIAQQREIMEQIERSKNSSNNSFSSSYPGAGATRQTTQPLVSSHEISPGNHVQLYSQEATKNAVKSGEAHVVKCISCNGWMQVINR
ncbi:hypothetical protein TL16_g06004 [Triparma laevis f. inornata]|uniref:Uncharacterized protein n=1 Tax=Triparma laevis f. inornata TaxID=1714386 RepID=A0A9W7ALJ5_9STRA|nr:hypothetical protein TL16_g06004 [Triparma laevis f. inornata]